MDTIPVLLDTDIGSDIDDAVALAYLLRQPRCELLGISTVSGEPEKRAALADCVCQAAGRSEVPIHVGTEPPLLVQQAQPHAPQAEALVHADLAHRTFTNENTAINFLRRTIRARPGEVTLLAVGPLTNVALLFARDPEVPALLGSLVIMGGWFFDRPQPEWNIRCDPHAAAMVFAAGCSNFRAVGIDVTQKCRMDADTCRRRFAQAAGPLAPVAAFAEVWFRHSREITFHDPLAAAALFEPDLCCWEEHTVDIELTNPKRMGQTFPEWTDRHEGGSGSANRHRLAADVNPEAFFAHYFEVVGASADHG